MFSKLFGKSARRSSEFSRRPRKVDAIRRFLALGAEVNTVIDVGIQFGTPELIEVFPDRHHLLCEPVEEFHQSIISTYTRRGVSHTLDRRAVSDADGEAVMDLSSVLEGHDVTHARLRDQEDITGTARPIETVRLDRLVEELAPKPPYFLKIDVDGAEERIIAGARATLPDCSGVIVEASTTDLIARSAGFLEAGFLLFDIVDLCYYDRRLAQFDLFFANPAYLAPGKRDVIEPPFDYEKWWLLE